MVGVCIDPVTAQVMMTFERIAMSAFLLRAACRAAVRWRLFHPFAVMKSRTFG
jgi:hypothetical protein